MRDSDYSHPNHLLAAVMAAGSERLLSGLEMVSLKFGDVLYESECRIRYAYFPTTSIISLVYMMEDGATDEIAAVGNEGIIGVPLFMGSETTPSRAVVRCAGCAFRLKGHVLLDEFNQSMAVQQLLLRYTQSLFAQISQTAACNRHHSVHQQLCRWLLSSLDRLPSNELKITHESIAGMLGVRRESVSKEAAELQSAGLIHNGRGRITVVDRRRLEARACECYRGIKREFGRLLNPVVPEYALDSAESKPACADAPDRAPNTLERHGLNTFDEATSMKHQLPPLPYDYAALEPHIDARTMQLHHDKHHASYVEKLNAALEKYPDLQQRPAAWLLTHLDEVPQAARTAVRNNAGGHVNHSMYWRAMAPKGGGAPRGGLADAITRDFGSFAKFKTQFDDAGGKLFGSGWVWLARAKDTGKLVVLTTPGHDNPIMQGNFPIVVNDVWEHAYYLKHQNRRPEFLEGWWLVANWQEAARRFDHAEKSGDLEFEDEGVLQGV